MDKKYVFGIVALIVFGLFLTGCETKFTQEEVDAQVAAAQAEAKAEAEAIAVKQLAEAEQLAAEQLAAAEALAAEELAAAEELKDAKISELEDEITELTPAPATEEELGYVIDEIAIGDTVTKTLSDKNINLFDGVVSFDSHDYDAEESLELIALLQDVNGNDYKENTYLQIPAESIRYVFSVESSFDTALIGVDDEALEINLLGKEVEISKWEGGKITLTSGTEYTFEEGESKVIEGQTVTVVTISDSTGKVMIKVGEESAVIYEYDMESFANLDVYVKEVLANEAGEVSPDIVTLKIGKDIETVIEDGAYDEDDDNNVWEWEITDKTIELFNAEEFMYLDEEDTEFNVLGAGKNICLPNDYVCVKYNGLDEEATETYKFDLYSKEGNEYIRVKGNFVNGLNDFAKIYIDPDTDVFYDEDLEVIAGDIELADSGLTLDTEQIELLGHPWHTHTHVLVIDSVFSSVKLNYALDKVRADSNDISGNEDNYRTLYGLIVENPEQSCEDQEFTVVVPQEQLMGSIIIY